MSLRVGDTMFLPRGETAVITDFDRNSNSFKVSAEPGLNKESRRHGYINGISKEDRSSLMNLLDRVQEIDDPKERIGELRKKLDELSADPHQWQMARYVESEMAHMMNMFGIKPTTYTAELGMLKDPK